MASSSLLAGIALLIVDDDETSREALADALSELGARVSSAPSAASALERLRGERFDAVCSDLEMPGESGTTLARAIRERADGPHPALVAISGLIDDGDDAGARAAGFDACWPKPVDVQALALALRHLVDGARRRQFDRNSPAVFNAGT